MGYFDALRHVRASDADDPLGIGSGGGGPTAEPEIEAGAADPPEPTSDYDRVQWHKKLKRLLNELLDAQGELVATRHPETGAPIFLDEPLTLQREWDDLMLEAGALGFDPEWVAKCQREEFHLLVRRAVSDRVITEREQHKLDRARLLIGMSEAEAEAALHAIVAEAESFFGKPVREG